MLLIIQLKCISSVINNSTNYNFSVRKSEQWHWLTFDGRHQLKKNIRRVGVLCVTSFNHSDKCTVAGGTVTHVSTN